jgi:drug/metabolite transporter (DMT)-like permease
MKSYKDYLPYLAGIGTALIFGLSFLFTKQALDSLPAIFLLACRFTLAAFLLTVIRLTGAISLNYKNKPLKGLIILAVFQPIAYFVFETIGIQLTSSSEAGIMIALIPIVVTVLAMVFLKERPGKAQLFFIAASVAGVVFIVLMSGDSNSAAAPSHMAGILSLLGAVLAGGIYNILSRKLSESFTPVEITFVMMWTGAIAFSLWSVISALAKGRLIENLSLLGNGNILVPILYLGILSSVCAFFMLNYMLSKLPASNSTVFSNLTTVVSIIAGVFIRHEAFHWYQLFGGAMIILGVWGTNRYKALPEAPEEATESL